MPISIIFFNIDYDLLHKTARIRRNHDMDLRDVLLTLQYASIIGLFLEAWIVFRNIKGRLHSYLLIGSIAALVNNMGYVLELKAENESAYISALQFSYLGRTWYPYFVFLFIMELVGVRIPSKIKNVMMIIDAVIYITIFNLQNHTLYYTDIYYDTSGIFPRLQHGNGIMHHFNMAFQFMLAGCALVCLFRALRKEKKKVTRNSLITVMMATFVQAFFLVAQLTHMFSLSDFYDVSMIGYFIGTIMMLIAIISFDLLGTREIAKEFIIDRISEGIIAVDNEGAIKYFNEPAEELYPELAAGKDRGADRILPLLTDAVAKKEYLKIKDHFYSVEENSLIRNGQDYGKLYALSDETDHIHYTEELERQKKIADDANAAKSRFLANMSHEIRTPINAVIGMDEMILRESSEEEIRGYASGIMSAGKTLLALINDILDLSKVEEGKMEIIPVRYELSSMVNNLVNIISGRAEKKGLKFCVEVDPHIPKDLVGDEIRIRQCALNILTNAVKYTEKGSVTLKFSYKDMEEGAGSDGRNIALTLSVTDTGIGMKPEDLEKLLKPYQRIDEKRNRQIEGTGLGMSITSQLLHLMGSRLEVESEYGRGTCMSFTIVQQAVSSEEIGKYDLKYRHSGKGIPEYSEMFHAPDARILVVDDTDINLLVMRNLLKKTQIQIDTASSGSEALALNSSNTYDALFIDHMMPDMDGLETLKKLRGSGHNLNAPAIALTANAISGAREMYIEAGFDGYLSKPVESEKLEMLLMNILPQNKIKEQEKDNG